MKDKNIEILELAEEILKNIELDEIPLRNVLLKCARLARLTENQNAIDLFNYELSGYPKDDKGYIVREAFELARNVNRPFKQADKNGIIQEYMVMETIAELEAELDAANAQMKVAHDRDVSVSSSNPNQYVFSPTGNYFERNNLTQKITTNSKKLHQIKNGYYTYVVTVYYKQKFGDITENIFQKKKYTVDQTLSAKVPDAIQKFVSAYENLRSNNQEDWANAVHSCRRIIKDVADSLFPPSNVEIEIGDSKKIKLNDDNYIARLKEYIKQKSSSQKFNQIVGSHLDYIGDRVDAIYRSTTKGSHDKVGQEEAERYVIYTYLILADILSL